MIEIIKGGILGLCIGDALGVPVEFESRTELKKKPVTNMRAYGTHNQPKGTWSDDSTMTLCLADSIAECHKIHVKDIMDRFLSWIEKNSYTAHNELFDIGTTTRKALINYKNNIEPLECGGKSEYDNGNGALMRILPLAFYINQKYGLSFFHSDEMWDEIETVCALTHAHPRNIIACMIYLATAVSILHSKNFYDAENRVNSILQKYKNKKNFSKEVSYFMRLCNFQTLKETKEHEIQSSGYVVHTLEASFWCILNSSSYEECVLKAVNLGDDTDTTAAVAGGLAGILYGYEGIPDIWKKEIAGLEWIETICYKLSDALLELK